MTEVWVLTLVVAAVGYMGGLPGPAPSPLDIRLPIREGCEAVRRFLVELDPWVREAKLHVGECRRVLLEEPSGGGR
ncbi:MAG TPA: hypothetical protein VGV13_00970 [Methylomirabilota bacterium]|nr:hypothetical protein [Methylomirabilota bacterium]